MNQIKTISTDKGQLDINVDTNWHPMETREVLEALATTVDGLSPGDVEGRQQVFGKNILPTARPPGVLSIFLRQFLSPLIYILVAAGVVAIVIDEITDAIFIFAVILINALLGTYQEWKAEQSAAALHSLLRITTTVRRDGEESLISAEELVPGDVVLLESGNKIPADLRLLTSNALSIDESLLTGESLPVDKSIEVVPGDAPTSERHNMAFAGTTVMSGRATGIVVATGVNTEVGKIARSVTTTEMTKAPLVIRMEAFARQISFVVVGACIMLAIVATAKGVPLAETFFLAVALAVAAIPEGLPVAITVALSIGVTRMSKRNVIVRKLTAVEGLGSCTYISSDKTGTLTVNQQTVKLVLLPDGDRFEPTGEGYSGEGTVLTIDGDPLSEEHGVRLEKLAHAAILCNEANLYRKNDKWNYRGDPMDVALLAFAFKLGIDPATVRKSATILGEIPFESERRYAAVFYSADDAGFVALKGAVESVIPFCDRADGHPGERLNALDEVQRWALELARGGYRVLAIAGGELDEEPRTSAPSEEDIPPLKLLGLVAFIDPLRPEVPDAIATCRRAGIQVGMVTGDHPATAVAIARELGIADEGESVRTGSQLMEAGEPGSERFVKEVQNAVVFARVAPLQKLHIVDALIRSGHFVAVTGDGVNDAPALKRANIGVAMGSGTDVAKDTSSIIITDDNFASIVAGVEEGRIAYSNIRKVIYLLVATGASELILFTLALIAGLPLPLFAVQLLWLNLVTNGFQHIGLSFEPGESDTMVRPPRRPTESTFDRLMIEQIVFAGLAMGFVAFGSFYLLLEMGFSEFDSRNRTLLLMVLLENFHVFNCRSERVSAFKIPLLSNPILVLAVIAAQGVHILSMYIPFTQEVLRIGPVSLKEWIVPFTLASSVLVTMEIFKLLKNRQEHRSNNSPTRKQGHPTATTD